MNKIVLGFLSTFYHFKGVPFDFRNTHYSSLTFVFSSTLQQVSKILKF